MHVDAQPVCLCLVLFKGTWVMGWSLNFEVLCFHLKFWTPTLQKISHNKRSVKKYCEYFPCLNLNCSILYVITRTSFFTIALYQGKSTMLHIIPLQCMEWSDINLTTSKMEDKVKLNTDRYHNVCMYNTVWLRSQIKFTGLNYARLNLFIYMALFMADSAA